MKRASIPRGLTGGEGWRINVRVNITIFGYPGTGKSTLFRLLGGRQDTEPSASEGRKDIQVRIRRLPDDRLDGIAALHPDKKVVPAAVEIVDLAGISLGDVKTSLYLDHLRKADGLVHVVRAFRDPRVPSPSGKIDPSADVRAMEEELILSDLIMTESRIARLDAELKKRKSPEEEKEKDILERLRPLLESGRGISEAELEPHEEKALRSFAFLSRKNIVPMINLDEKDLAFLSRPNDLPDFSGYPGPLLAFCGRIEEEIMCLEDQEKTLFTESFGIDIPGAEAFLQHIPKLLDTVTFFTIGKDEIRAWMIPQGSPARRAAGAVHTDMEKGFIRAEVVPCGDLLSRGSLAGARESGCVRLEGKDYIVRDGDILHIRFTS